jgi:ABC-type nitrate/sulfonate/bicarbonate transport system permease component|uniref:Putative membrane protein n=1 Tax=Rhodococcus sp. Mel TaxID=1093626 RepID=H8ZKT1_9NOCA|nr:putative membrane protein [Rhodococcus sp. Mel]
MHSSSVMRGISGRLLLGAAGIITFAVLWEVAGRMRLLGDSWPPLTEIWTTLSDPSNRTQFERAVGATLEKAAFGYVIGTSAAIVFAAVAALIQPIRRQMLDLAAIVNAIPILALGPLLIALFPREVTPVAISALTVFFTTVIATTAGIESAGPAHQDLATTLGANRLRRFWRVEAPAALPSLLDGLKLAAPSAVLGALLGEWFGTERGLGQLLVVSMQNYRVDMLWSAGLLAAGIALIAYGMVSIVERSVSERFRMAI